MLSIYENKKYKIKCNKCGHVFKYDYSNCLVKVVLDDKQKPLIVESGFVECPNCSKEYDFGYESRK